MRWLVVVLVMLAMAGCYYEFSHPERGPQMLGDQQYRQEQEDDGWSLQYGYKFSSGTFGIGFGSHGWNWIPLTGSGGGSMWDD